MAYSDIYGDNVPVAIGTHVDVAVYYDHANVDPESIDAWAQAM